ncbi:MAG: DUF3987 domain-containing protein [Thermomicrobiales bacterium]
MGGRGGRIAVLPPEGGVFAMIGGRYACNGDPNEEVYLKGHAGDDLRVDRVGLDPDHVSRPALTIGLAVQPGVVARMADRPEFRERGLPARFLFGMPASLVGRRRVAPPPLPEAVRDACHAVVQAVLELPRCVGGRGAGPAGAVPLRGGGGALPGVRD